MIRAGLRPDIESQTQMNPVTDNNTPRPRAGPDNRVRP